MVDIECVFHSEMLLFFDSYGEKMEILPKVLLNTKWLCICLVQHLHLIVPTFVFEKQLRIGNDISVKRLNTVLKNLYVDDCLTSVKSVKEAVILVKDLQRLLDKGGFHISKWISNSRNVMNSIPVSERA